MPTYTNNYHKPINVRDSHGKPSTLMPGKTIQTVYFTDDPNITKDADTPYFNDVLATEEVALSATPEEVSIDIDADIVLVIQITDAVTVYRQSVDNTPAVLTNYTDPDRVIPIKANGTLDKLVLTGTGTCRVQQMKL